jgi:hypothetical protein
MAARIGNGSSTEPQRQDMGLMIRLNRLLYSGSLRAAFRSTASHIVTVHVDAGFIVFEMRCKVLKT